MIYEEYRINIYISSCFYIFYVLKSQTLLWDLFLTHGKTICDQKFALKLFSQLFSFLVIKCLFVDEDAKHVDLCYNVSCHDFMKVSLPEYLDLLTFMLFLTSAELVRIF